MHEFSSLILIKLHKTVKLNSLHKLQRMDKNLFKNVNIECVAKYENFCD